MGTLEKFAGISFGMMILEQEKQVVPFLNNTILY